MNKAMLYYNGSDEDKEAINLLLESKTPCELMGSISEVRTPLLIVGLNKYEGLAGVEDYIKEQQAVETTE